MHATVERTYQMKLTYEEYSYYITFEEELLVQNKGYRQKSINDETEKNRLKNLEENTYRATLWIAIATCFAAFYYSIEIGKDIYCLLCKK